MFFFFIFRVEKVYDGECWFLEVFVFYFLFNDIDDDDDYVNECKNRIRVVDEFDFDDIVFEIVNEMDVKCLVFVKLLDILLFEGDNIIIFDIMDILFVKLNEEIMM